MSDLILESTRFVITAIITGVLWRARDRRGWRSGADGHVQVLAGFGLLLFGTLLDPSRKFFRMPLP